MVVNFLTDSEFDTRFFSQIDSLCILVHALSDLGQVIRVTRIVNPTIVICLQIIVSTVRDRVFDR